MPLYFLGGTGVGKLRMKALYLHSLSICRALDHSRLTLHRLGIEVVGDFTPKLQRGNWDSDNLYDSP